MTYQQLKKQIDLIHNECFGLAYILWGYQDVEKRISQTKEAFEDIQKRIIETKEGYELMTSKYKEWEQN